MPEVSRKSRSLGCLLGGAIGDALGASIEFETLAEIRARFGPRGLLDFPESTGSITDDTQMTLFTGEGILRAIASGSDLVPSVHRSYLRWLATQGIQHPLVGELDGSLVGERELWRRRAPGNTCLTALANAQVLGEAADNDSKGCGTIMRIAPVGLVFDLPQAFELGARLSALTHGHATGILSGAFFAAVVSGLLAGQSLRTSIDQARAELCSRPDAGETLDAIDRALGLAAFEGEPSAERLETLGGGWVAEEALAIALYAALTARDFTHAVLLAVNHSGDSDSTGSLAGNLMGALQGSESLPRTWVDRIELRATIEEIARALGNLKAGRSRSPGS